MTVELFTGLALFSFVSSITPGPNNLMLMASGANFGFRRTLPHMLGVGLGFTAMVTLVGLGLVGLFEAYPLSYEVLKVVSVVYLVYLAWKIATSAAPAGTEVSADTQGKPITFIQAVLFQWVNPKAWTMALTALTVYAPSQNFLSVLLVAVVFGGINLPCVSLWTLLGQQLQRLLTSRRRLVVFNVSMAVLLVVSLYPVLLT
ncbi:MAG: LysE family translocator [Halioglobus sp.]|jgi:threonine/homoserine/homoserine lactone efflux protein|nr:LysE family translocator [Halieaceae bacterium]MBT7720915.1 LysE family translocator [Halieaceae bacterium]MDG1389424.1 LysE family translocator [Halioglobus sp.]MDG2326944.1 LysE family translocator [Halioglobus sp.]